MSILVTIGIVAKNEAENIEKTLESVINQNFRKCDAFSNLSEIKDFRFPNVKRLRPLKSKILEDFDHSKFEIIVVDGNSDDKTREVAENVLNSSNIKYQVLNEKDFGFYGLCFARNIVIDNASSSSKYIAFTDADCIVEENWLQELLLEIENTGDKVAGAGGPRLVALTKNKKEVVINHYLTSFIASAGNPAFSKRDVKFLDSIPNYNSIYKKEIIQKFRYDDSLIISDDNELNYRLKKAGYKFVYGKNAEVYHGETDSIMEFGKNMFNYGVNITNTIKKHRIFKIKPFISLIFLIYLIFIIPLYLIIGWLILIPLMLYFILAILTFAEILFKTKTVYSVIVFLLMPIQHVCYAYGIIYNLLFIRPVHKNNS
ncbi:MAG: glycosyltransferase [Methanobacterium sp.]|uniref:glycosyltransferase n=1 Tax=Methanobacterium sp. TaxID=2164 RepID=UPI003D65896E|nr:glycosyltransferase [Methanobacterium sp.]